MNRFPALSWGRVHRYAHTICDAGAVADLSSLQQPALPYGLGRSYGDSCLNEGGILLSTERQDRFIAFDRDAGILICEAGATLRDILRLCARPNGDGSHWFLPALPGTKFVTVGGAIANDVHGKNHHGQGTFGHHVLSFRLRRSDGDVLHCSPASHSDLFFATIGGLGLTGLIEEATLQLMHVPGLCVEVEDIAIPNLSAFYDLSAASANIWDYTVAWVDCGARGKAIGRGIFSRARHVPGRFDDRDLLPRFSIPFAPPIGPINRWSLPVLNGVYRRRLGGKTCKRRTVTYDRFFFPLDAIGGWNRLYGKAGFYQYQCVIPPVSAPEIISRQLEEIARSGEGSFLVVLKTFGSRTSCGMLSFPMTGTTLAVDFPNRGASTLALLEKLDGLTLEGGGRVFPAKDGRMTKATFLRYYPRAADFERFTDPRFSSSFWRRVRKAEEAHS